jgi:flagellar protein FlgJ
MQILPLSAAGAAPAPVPAPAPATVPAPAPAERHALLQIRARELETVFLAEMLAHSGLSGRQHQFDGGMGEQQFESLLRYEQARMMVKRGGIGLAEQLFRGLAGQDGER